MIELTRELEEALLGRTVRDVLTPADRRAIAGRRVIITGAGGSVGSELSRQIASCAPEALALFDHSEYSLFRIEQELRRLHPDRGHRSRLGRRDAASRRARRLRLDSATRCVSRGGVQARRDDRDVHRPGGSRQRARNA